MNDSHSNKCSEDKQVQSAVQPPFHR